MYKNALSLPAESYDVVRMDGKTKYTAETQLIHERFYSGYTLICTEILGDTEA